MREKIQNSKKMKKKLSVEQIVGAGWMLRRN